nr:phosphoglycerate mutase [Ramlibacter albus]
MQRLDLPHLEKLLARLAPEAADEGEATTLTLPHERVLARECGLSAPDGQLPWAAWQVQQGGRETGDEAWAWLTPCHWRVGADHIAMTHPQELQLSAGESRALLDAMQPYFTEDGLAVEYDAPTLWLARGEMFRNLPAASLDRAIGRHVDAWLPRTEAARPVRRLQQEMQMLLYTHPINEARTLGGLPPVNSFWVSGTGALPASHRPAPPAGLAVTHYLRDAALLDDAAAWAAAWHQLDNQECTRLLQAADRGDAVRLTLAGERNARTWSSASQGLWRRVSNLFSRPAALPVLQSL